MLYPASGQCSPVPVIAGPTASGKTVIAVRLAHRLNAEIISADSRQIYRRLDIGTAKPTPLQRRLVRHHLIDILEPTERYDAGRFVRDALAAIADIQGRGKLPMIVGGTGLYIRALVCGLADLPSRDEAIRAGLEQEVRRRGTQALFARLQEADPETAAGIDRHNPARLIRALEVLMITGKGLAAHHRSTTPPALRFRQILLSPAGADLRGRIQARCRRMLAAGMIAETRRLLAGGIPETAPGLAGIGYPAVIDYVRGRIDREQLADRLTTETWQYARRQMTWFKKERDIYIVKKGFSLDSVENALNSKG